MQKAGVILKLLIRYIKSNKQIYKSFDFSHKQQKYTLREILVDILYVLKTGISWRDLRSHIGWNTVYKRYIMLNNFGVFEICYTDLLKKYLKKGTNKKLKYILTDTSFVQNKKGQDMIGYNKFYKKKKGTKISLITDSNGIPISVKCYKGNKHDCKILDDQLNDKYITNIKYVKDRYFLADLGYDSTFLRNKLKSMDYKSLILQKKTVKNPLIKISFTDEEKKIYNKRMAIERMFNLIKMNRRLSLRYDVKIQNFMGFIYLALIKILC